MNLSGIFYGAAFAAGHNHKKHPYPELTLGSMVSFAAVLSMIGLFIANSLAGTRVPFAMAEDGMMPKFLVKVHSRYGTPWVTILLCGVLYSIFSMQAFSLLVVVDVFLNWWC